MKFIRLRTLNSTAIVINTDCISCIEDNRSDRGSVVVMNTDNSRAAVYTVQETIDDILRKIELK